MFKRQGVPTKITKIYRGQEEICKDFENKDLSVCESCPKKKGCTVFENKKSLEMNKRL